MRLAPGERSILAGFGAMDDAQAAATALKEAGFHHTQVDRIAPFGYSTNVEYQRPALSGAEPSLVDSVIQPAQLDHSTRILLGAFPEASGMAGGPTADHHPFLLTTVTYEDRWEEAAAIIEHHGGRV